MFWKSHEISVQQNNIGTESCLLNRLLKSHVLLRLPPTARTEVQASRRGVRPWTASE